MIKVSFRIEVIQILKSVMMKCLFGILFLPEDRNEKEKYAL